MNELEMERIVRLEDAFVRMEKEVRGNGTIGLVTRMALVESWQKNTEKFIRGTFWIGGLTLATVLSGLILELIGKK